MFLLCFLKKIIVFVNFYGDLVGFDTLKEFFQTLEQDVKNFW